MNLKQWLSALLCFCILIGAAGCSPQNSGRNETELLAGF